MFEWFGLGAYEKRVEDDEHLRESKNFYLRRLSDIVKGKEEE